MPKDAGRRPAAFHARSAVLAMTLLASLLAGERPLHAQTIDDGLMMPKKSFCTGFIYTRDAWDEYWEGDRKRDNGNIGTLTTQSVTYVGNYGITNRLNVIAMAPYVWTEASQGVLQGQSGFQDATLALKYNLLETAFTSQGVLRTIVVASGSTPLSDYTPDFMPLSIGSASSRLSSRLTLMFQAKKGFFLLGTGAYTLRGNVTLNRPSYFTDGALTLSNEVALPDVFDYSVSAGYTSPRLNIPISFGQQVSLGGGDIRRQDMPFVSNRMNVSRLDAVVMYYLPMAKDLAVRVSGMYALGGRNVGQSTAFTAGLLYTFKF
jgi:hypothetical protein